SLGEIDVGFVFAAAAAECRLHDSVTAQACRADAEQCYSAAMKLLRDCKVPAGQQHYLKLRLDQLRKQLDRLAGDAAAYTLLSHHVGSIHTFTTVFLTLE